MWSAVQKIQYATMMLYHNIKNSDDNRKVKQVAEEQKNKINLRISFIRKCKKLQKIYKLILVMSPRPVQ